MFAQSSWPLLFTFAMALGCGPAQNPTPPSQEIAPTKEPHPAPSTIHFCDQDWPIDTTSIDCSDTYVENLSAIATLSNLKVLDLTGSLTPGSEFPKLAKLTNLRELYLSEAPYEDEVVPLQNLRFVRSLPKLEVLDLSCRYFDGPMFDELVHAKALKRLSVCYVSDFRQVAKLSNLEELQVLGAPSDLRPLSGLSKLRKLHLSGNDDVPATLIPLKELGELEELNLEYTRIPSLAPLSQLHNLRTLAIRAGLGGTGVSDLISLGQNKKLESFRHSHVESARGELRELSRMLPKLRFDPPLTEDEPTPGN